MTRHDPMQGILVSKPGTLRFVANSRPLVQSKPRQTRTDRLQGILVATRPTVAKTMPSEITDLDDLSMEELESLASSVLAASRKEKEASNPTVRLSGRSLIHSIRLPLHKHED